MTLGVHILLHHIGLVAQARGWDKDKTILKLQDCITALNGGDPPAHSEVEKQKAAQADPPISPADSAWLKALDLKLKAPEPPTST
jgi:hypothetical protein